MELIFCDAQTRLPARPQRHKVQVTVEGAVGCESGSSQIDTNVSESVITAGVWVHCRLHQLLAPIV